MIPSPLRDQAKPALDLGRNLGVLPGEAGRGEDGGQPTRPEARPQPQPQRGSCLARELSAVLKWSSRSGGAGGSGKNQDSSSSFLPLRKSPPSAPISCWPDPRLEAWALLNRDASSGPRNLQMMHHAMGCHLLPSPTQRGGVPAGTRFVHSLELSGGALLLQRRPRAPALPVWSWALPAPAL